VFKAHTLARVVEKISGQFPAKHEKARSLSIQTDGATASGIDDRFPAGAAHKNLVIKLLTQQYLHENLFHGVEEVKIVDCNSLERLVDLVGIELEPVWRRERSGSRQAKS